MSRLPFSADCFRCRRPGLPAARGDRGRRYYSQPEPHAYGCGAGAGGAQTRKLGFQLSNPSSAQLVRAAATLREGAPRTLGHDLVRPRLAYKSTSNLVYFPPAQAHAHWCLIAVWQFSGFFRKPRPGTPTTRHGTRRVARFQLDLARRPKTRRDLRGAEACPGYCKQAGASQRTYSASIDQQWT